MRTINQWLDTDYAPSVDEIAWCHRTGSAAPERIARDWMALGTLPASETAGSIAVEVMAWPARFYRFTITSAETGAVYVLETGSGRLADYLPSIERIAAGMLVPTVIDKTSTVSELEAAAHTIYAAMQQFSDEGKVRPWVEGGNSLAQDAARRAARQILSETKRAAQAEDALSSQLIERQAQLLTGVVNAIRGEPDELSLHSHHDAAELAAAVVEERNALRTQLKSLTGALESATTPAAFLEYMDRNYPSGTVISDIGWHTPKIWRAAIHSLRANVAASGATLTKEG